jgi:hypothetical protein
MVFASLMLRHCRLTRCGMFVVYFLLHSHWGSCNANSNFWRFCVHCQDTGCDMALLTNGHLFDISAVPNFHCVQTFWHRATIWINDSGNLFWSEIVCSSITASDTQWHVYCWIWGCHSIENEDFCCVDVLSLPRRSHSFKTQFLMPLLHSIFARRLFPNVHPFRVSCTTLSLVLSFCRLYSTISPLWPRPLHRATPSQQVITLRSSQMIICRHIFSENCTSLPYALMVLGPLDAVLCLLCSYKRCVQLNWCEKCDSSLCIITCFRNKHTEVNLRGWYIGVGWPYIRTVYKACTLFWFFCANKFIPVSLAYNELEMKFLLYHDLCFVCFQILFCIFIIKSFGEIYIFRKGT